MGTDATSLRGRDIDETDAHTLFYAAYAMIPAGSTRPSNEALRLLHAAARAWAKHLDAPADRDDRPVLG